MTKMRIVETLGSSEQSMYRVESENCGCEASILFDKNEDTLIIKKASHSEIKWGELIEMLFDVTMEEK